MQREISSGTTQDGTDYSRISKCLWQLNIFCWEVVRREQAEQHFIPPQLNMLVILAVSLFSISDICLIFGFLSDWKRILENVSNLRTKRWPILIISFFYCWQSSLELTIPVFIQARTCIYYTLLYKTDDHFHYHYAVLVYFYVIKASISFHLRIYRETIAGDTVRAISQ